MKNLWVVLLLTGCALGQSSKKTAAPNKPYHGYMVKITSVQTNAHGVRFIYGTEERPPSASDADAASPKLRSFSFYCNEEAETCETPALERVYGVLDLHLHAYKCDNYTLTSDASVPVSQRQLIAVCLNDVY